MIIKLSELTDDTLDIRVNLIIENGVMRGDL